MRLLILSLLFVVLAGGCAQREFELSNQMSLAVTNPWYDSGHVELQHALLKQTNNQAGSAKNIILMVGDGMSLPTVTASRIYAGQLEGKTGEEHRLSFEEFPWTGLAKTYNTNQQSPDSAGTITAMMTGIKTKAGFIGIDERATRGDCNSSQGAEVMSMLEIAEQSGKATGVITNTRITHATPASSYAKSPERQWESDNNLPADADACKDIALQLLEFDIGNGIEVMMGGGRRHFLPKEVVDVEGKKGRRNDNRNLLEEWSARHPQGQLVQSKNELDQILLDGSVPLLGLFSSSNMRYAPDRPKDKLGEPNLAEMTRVAISRLQQQDKGFFLLIEGGRIDHAHHAGNAKVALIETLEFADAVAVADDMTDDEDTLIIVTADHSNSFVAGGYATRGNPILGKVVHNDSRGVPENSPAVDTQGNSYTTLGYLNGPGFASLGPDSTDADDRYSLDIVNGRQSLEGVDTEEVGFHQEVLVSLEDASHSPVDVPVYAKGPGAHLISGSIEQHLIFHTMRHAGGF